MLDDVNLELPAGMVVAIVGENGAGKTTLVKLVAKLYEPDAGRILVDGADLARMPRRRMAHAPGGRVPGLLPISSSGHGTPWASATCSGWMTRPPSSPPSGVPAPTTSWLHLRSGLETQLGSTWPQGVEVSFGQWQKLALARGFMRDHPLLLVLDEPTAALDAETEHALFERYAAAARGRGNHVSGAEGRITILVSHRFSTVRMADLIVVLDGARVAEVGTHEDLMARGGQYAELYGMQAAAYR